MDRNIISLLVLVFLLGWIGHNAYGQMWSGYEFKLDEAGIIKPTLASAEKDSPQDRVKEGQIHVYDDKVILNIKNPEWSRFTDTNSMDPVIDAGANAIHVVPKSVDDIQIGDIVAYESEYVDGTVIHRVIDIGTDTIGKFFVLKGDNNPNPDPGKVRFNQIKRVLVAIIY